MLGLQLISPMLAAGAGVMSSVEAPRLEAAAAASQPAEHQTLTSLICSARHTVMMSDSEPVETSMICWRSARAYLHGRLQ